MERPPPLRGLPYLPGVPHLHENRPLAESRLQVAALEVRIRVYFKKVMTLYSYWVSYLRLSKIKFLPVFSYSRLNTLEN